jgi:hypothetical protein
MGPLFGFKLPMYYASAVYNMAAHDCGTNHSSDTLEANWQSGALTGKSESCYHHDVALESVFFGNQFEHTTALNFMKKL